MLFVNKDNRLPKTIMTMPSLIVIVIALATIGSSNAAGDDEHCENPVFCVEKPTNYDTYQNHIDAIVERNKELISKTYFHDLTDTEPVTSGDDDNCMAVTTVEKPFVIKNNISAEYVVQSSNFEQKIRVTKCKNAQSPCFGRVKEPGFDVETFCEEKFGAVSLYIYDPKVNEVRYKMFEVPVCCACKFRSSKK